jgi:CRP-like cAMP-binding protein
MVYQLVISPRLLTQWIVMKFNLSSIPLFSGLPDDCLAYLTDSIQSRHYAKNTIIFSEGDTADALYIVDKGQISIYISNDRGDEMLLNALGPGDCFGELAMIDQETRSASAKSTCDTHVCAITSASLRACIEMAPEITLNMMKSLASLLRTSTESQKQLALLDVYGRLRETLLKMADIEQYGKVIVPKPTHRELASRIGASREMVSRLLKDLRLGGYIDSDNRQIYLRRNLPEKW